MCAAVREREDDYSDDDDGSCERMDSLWVLSALGSGIRDGSRKDVVGSGRLAACGPSVICRTLSTDVDGSSGD
jgi:hypothetical protein